MKLMIKLYVGKENERTAKLEITGDGTVLMAYPIPKSSLEALLSGESKSIILE